MITIIVVLGAFSSIIIIFRISSYLISFIIIVIATDGTAEAADAAARADEEAAVL